MIHITKTKPLLFALVFVGVTGVGFVWMLYEINSMGEKLQVSLQTIANDQVVEAQYAELQSVLEKTAEERELLERFILSDETDTITFLSELDDAAHALGLEFTTGELQINDQEGPIDTLSVSFDMKGPESKFLRMVQIFETLPYHGSIRSLTFARSIDRNTGTNIVSGRIALTLSIRDYD